MLNDPLDSYLFISPSRAAIAAGTVFLGRCCVEPKQQHCIKQVCAPTWWTAVKFGSRTNQYGPLKRLLNQKQNKTACLCVWPIKQAHQLLLLKMVMKWSWQIAAAKSEQKQSELMNPQQSAWLSICFHNPHKQRAHGHAHKHAWRVWLSVCVWLHVYVQNWMLHWRWRAFIYYHVSYLGSPANLSGATGKRWVWGQLLSPSGHQRGGGLEHISADTLDACVSSDT